MSELDRWVAALAEELGVATIEVDVPELLDLARVAAHEVDRPAAPVTTYVVGYAAGLAQARRELVEASDAVEPAASAAPAGLAELAARAAALARRWSSEPPTSRGKS